VEYIVKPDPSPLAVAIAVLRAKGAAMLPVEKAKLISLERNLRAITN
jgi:hypothetical protein